MAEATQKMRPFEPNSVDLKVGGKVLMRNDYMFPRQVYVELLFGRESGASTELLPLRGRETKKCGARIIPKSS